jgi:hypothetical protein
VLQLRAEGGKAATAAKISKAIEEQYGLPPTNVSQMVQMILREASATKNVTAKVARAASPKNPYADWATQPVVNPEKPWQHRYAAMGNFLRDATEFTVRDRKTAEALGTFSTRAEAEAFAAKLFGAGK